MSSVGKQLTPQDLGDYKENNAHVFLHTPKVTAVVTIVGIQNKEKVTVCIREYVRGRLMVNGQTKSVDENCTVPRIHLFLPT